MEYALSTVRIFVQDLQRALNFYEEKLGMRIAYRNPAYGWAEIKTSNNITLGLEEIQTSDPEYGQLVGRFVGISFHVDNVQETYERLTLKGVVFESKPTLQKWGGFLAHFKDADDNVLIIVSESIMTLTSD